MKKNTIAISYNNIIGPYTLLAPSADSKLDNFQMGWNASPLAYGDDIMLVNNFEDSKEEPISSKVKSALAPSISSSTLYCLVLVFKNVMFELNARS